MPVAGNTMRLAGGGTTLARCDVAKPMYADAADKAAAK
jgi:hypothetical protein